MPSFVSVMSYARMPGRSARSVRLSVFQAGETYSRSVEVGLLHFRCSLVRQDSVVPCMHYRGGSGAGSCSGYSNDGVNATVSGGIARSAACFLCARRTSIRTCVVSVTHSQVVGSGGPPIPFPLLSRAAGQLCPGLACRGGSGAVSCAGAPRMGRLPADRWEVVVVAPRALSPGGVLLRGWRRCPSCWCSVLWSLHSVIAVRWLRVRVIVHVIPCAFASVAG